MSGIGQDTLALTFLVFCRIGACMMLVPGFSSTRVPPRIRLFIALALALALSPLLVPEIRARGVDAASPAFVAAIASELMIGLSIGILGRLFFLALETMATAAATAIGMSNNLEVSMEDGDAMPALATFVTLSATMLMFVTNLHWEIVRGLLASYRALPVGEAFGAQASLTRFVDVATEAFLVALRIASPFIIFSLVINLAFGLLNKMIPQMPVYFISAPFVLAGGLALLYFVGKQAVQIGLVGFALWIARG